MNDPRGLQRRQNFQVWGGLTLMLSLTWNVASISAADPQPERLPAQAKVTKLQAHPESVSIDGVFRYSQLQLTATLASGETLDVTRMVSWSAPDNLIQISPTGLVRPQQQDGAGRITASLAGLSVTIPVAVRGTQKEEFISFTKDVQPVLSRLGCNQGTCHGGAQGKNGFKLSLRGYDPIFDHRSLTDDIEGRRFNRAAPERSLMLLKPTGAVPHAGGVIIQPGDPNYELLRRWIAAGVQQDLTAPKVRSIRVTPAQVVIPMPGMKQQFSVVATYTDGTERDVSAEAFIETSNIETATVDKQGLMTTLRRGEATMLARYEGAYAASSVIIMGDRSGYAWKPQPVYNKIDELVDQKLQSIRVPLSELCTDEEFIRRVYLDLTGVPPTSDQVRAFLKDARPSRTKREALVDQLVGNPAFVEHWTNKWADLLQVNRKFLGDEGAVALRRWIHDAIAKNLPYDQFAYAILTASGSNYENPPAGYYKVLRTPDLVMENTTQLFLAILFNFNKCHDHPFEKWTQDQYYELAAYFAQISRKEDPKFKGRRISGTAVEGATPLIELILDQSQGDIKNERTGQVATTSFPYQYEGMPKLTPNGKDGPPLPRREQLARWLTHPKNPYFAKSYVNRIWSYLTGVGIIEPVDDIRAGNPPTNPALLDYLTQEFLSQKMDTYHLIRLICKSRTYQLSIQTNSWNRDDDQNYSHALPRRLPAEVLYDSIHVATGTPSRLPGLPRGARAAQLVDSNVELPGGFLELFGKPARESACECERSNTMMLGPVLAMVNGPIVAEAIQDPANRLNQLVLKTTNDAQLVEEIYLSVLNRYPTPRELELGQKALHAGQADYDRLTKEAQRKQSAFEAYAKGVPDKQAAWEADMIQKKPTRWQTLELVGLKSMGQATFRKNDDGSYTVTGANPATDTLQFSSSWTGPKLTAIRLEVLPDDSLPARGPGRAPNGNFVLNEFKLAHRPQTAPESAKEAKFKPAKIVNPQADHEQSGFPIANAVDNNAGTGWAIADRFGQPHTAVLPVQGGIPTSASVQLQFTLEQTFGGSHTIGRFRISGTADAAPSLKSAVSAELAQLLETPATQRTDAEKQKLRELYLATDREYARLQAEAAEPAPAHPRVVGAQDLVWALLNNPAFLFNR